MNLARRLRQLRAAIRELPDGATRARLDALVAVASGAPVRELEATAERLDRLCVETRLPDVCSDLAALGVRLAPALEDPRWAVVALDASWRALESEPAHREALFNRAAATEALFLSFAAVDAWRRYLSAETDAAWRAEAELRSASLAARQDDGPHSQGLLALWEAEGSTEPPAVGDHGQSIERRVLEQHLACWAEQAVSEPASADECLATAGRLGALLARSTGETLCFEAVATIESAGPRPREVLAAAHRDYAEGRTAFDAGRIEDAAPLLARALAGFRATGSPVGDWAELWLAGTDLYHGRVEAVAATLGRLAKGRSFAGRRSLEGRLVWAQGLAALRQGDFVEARGHFDAAARAFRVAGQGENRGAAETLTAETLRELGEDRLAAGRRQAAAATLSAYPTSVRRHNLLLDSSTAAEESGRLFAAEAFANEAVRAATLAERPPSLAEAYLWEARARRRRGALEASHLELVAARRAAEAIAGRAIREGVLAEIRAEEAFLAGSRGEAGLADLDAAIDYFTGRGLHIWRPLLLAARAEIHRGAGRSDRAVGDLEEALTEIERQSSGFGDARSELRHRDRARPMYEALVDLRLSRGESAEAFAAAERSRRLGFDRWPEAPALDEVSAAIPPGALLLHYTILADRLLVWAFRRGEAPRLEERRIARADLVDEVERAVAALREGEGAKSLAELARLLLGSAVGAPHPPSLLLIAPDGALGAVPFAALPGNGGRPLVETTAVALVPAAGYLAPPLSTPRRQSFDEGRVLLAGDAGVGERLPGAEKELEALRQLYPRALTLTGTELARTAFLRQLATAELLHFAGHAVENPGEPLNSYLRLHGSADAIEDRVYAADLFAAPLESLRLVVLAACGSAGAATRHATGASGLARPFLTSGRTAVVASLWPVDDEATRRLLTRFHERYREGVSPPAALRDAQLALLQGSDTRFRSPPYWAGFAVYGSTD